ncbi:hypothetical protein DFH09DRAFT_1315398 [Mycena vulgaris]|nr:hypothetical protein DFH09DRAFT_1315398 [Mycena vulgaris]
MSIYPPPAPNITLKSCSTPAASRCFSDQSRVPAPWSFFLFLPPRLRDSPRLSATAARWPTTIYQSLPGLLYFLNITTLVLLWTTIVLLATATLQYDEGRLHLLYLEIRLRH